MPLTLDLQAYSPAGSTLSFSNTGLPTGLSLNSSTGVITGTPTTAGNYLVTITVTVGSHSATGTFSWQIATAGIANPGDQTNTEGDTVSLQLAGVGPGTVTYSASGLPAGLSLDSQTGPHFGYNQRRRCGQRALHCGRGGHQRADRRQPDLHLEHQSEGQRNGA